MTVYIMDGLLVVATRGKAPEEPPKTSLAEIGVATGATIGGVTLDGSNMAVQVTKGRTQEVVVDIKKGVIVSRVRFKPEGQ